MQARCKGKIFFSDLYAVKILIIQTAFLGDVVLATPILEALHHRLPQAEIHMLVRKGNESLLANHPFLAKVWIWDKKSGKYRSLWKLLQAIRRERFDRVVNCQRFGASGLLTAFSGARETVGFAKNPFSRLFTYRLPHLLDGRHETERNLSLLDPWWTGISKDVALHRPKLYPSKSGNWLKWSADGRPYICIAPASVWFTKQFPAHKWIELLQRLDPNITVYLLGAPGDREICEQVRQGAQNGQTAVNLAGQLSLLDSAALMAGSRMNYVNDSAPMHLASAVNAPTAAVFCSTVPQFGFGPLSDDSVIVETHIPLDCRPCGLHGYAACPLGHFRCAETIDVGAFPI